MLLSSRRSKANSRLPGEEDIYELDPRSGIVGLVSMDLTGEAIPKNIFLLSCMIPWLLNNLGNVERGEFFEGHAGLIY